MAVIHSITDGGYFGDLDIVGSNRNEDVGLKVCVPAGKVAQFGRVSATNCFINLIKLGDGQLNVEQLVTRAFGGDNANIRASNVLISELEVSGNTPTRPYAVCIRRGSESVEDCLARCGEFVFDPGLLEFVTHPDYPGMEVIAAFHVDGICQLYAVGSDGFSLDPFGSISNIVIPSVFARIRGVHSQGLIGSERCDYHGIRIGEKRFDVQLDGYPYHTVFNTLRDSVIGGVANSVEAGCKLRIQNVKASEFVSGNNKLIGFSDQDVVCDAGALNGENEVVAVTDTKIIKMSNAGVRQLIESEDCIPQVYICPAGVPTIGVGHALSKSERSSGKIRLSSGVVIDFRDDRELAQSEVMALLQDDLISREAAVAEAVLVPLDQGNVDALVHFVFNIGIPAFLHSTLLKELNSGRYGEVPGQIKRWKYVTKAGRKVENDGLINRRLTEVRMWHGSDQRSDDMQQWKERMSQPVERVDADSSVGFLVDAARRLGVGAGAGTGAESDGFSGGLDETVKVARDVALKEMQAEVDAARADAVAVYRRVNSQKPMESRTNKSVLAMIVSTGLRVLVATTGLSAVFADPAVADIATGLVVGGMDVITVGFGALAIKFRNAATKFID